MPRILFSLLLAVLIVGWLPVCAPQLAAPAAAQTPATETPPAPLIDPDWPTYSTGLADPHALNRGPGYYFSIVKLVFLWLIFLAWVKSADWVSQDCQRHDFSYVLWNSVMVFPFLGIFLIFGLGVSYIGGPMVLLAYAVPFGLYVYKRNSQLPDHEKVFTPDHFRHILATRGKGMGVNISKEKKAEHEKGPPVTIIPQGGKDDQADQANLIQARQSPGFITAKELLADALGKRSDKIMLDYTREAVAAKYQVDGVWHQVEARERETGDMMLAVLKKVCNLNMEDRKNRQEGKFGIEYDGAKFGCEFASQGTQTGERVVLQITGRAKEKFSKLEDLGMRDKMRDQFKELLGDDTGFVVFSALPSGGLTTTITVALSNTDRLLRDFVALQEEGKDEPEVMNVDVTTFPAGQTPDVVLPKLLRKEPDVVVCRDLYNAETVRILCEHINDEKHMAITSVRAKEAVEALLRVLLLKAPAKEFAQAVTCVLNQRLVRKLCEHCKEGYEPPPALLQKLGIPAGRVSALFRERQPLPPDSQEKWVPCEHCGDIGYLGRTAIFELLVVDDKIREALVKKPELETLRKLARAAGTRTLQEEGIVLVAKGVTSITELQRVLKQ